MQLKVFRQANLVSSYAEILDAGRFESATFHLFIFKEWILITKLFDKKNYINTLILRNSLYTNMIQKHASSQWPSDIPIIYL